ncbi:MAG: enoyl-[acyl-carrier-protein] reductase FabK [Clostridiales bacterium]|jgi:enoyl-[acyl-carrier protein] reductase II|nr:enoyl-[acyl-carrier-protein] reductase FabK [Clostridiales bacterium]
METRLTKLLRIKYPVIQGGMAWVAEEQLAAAVSNAGGLGIIAGGGAPREVIREKIIRAKALTEQPFGLNIMLMSQFADDLAELAVEEGVQVVTTGAGSPGKYMERWKAHGVTVIPVVASVAQAVKMERLGADAVVGEGCEAGGHIGELTTMTLVPQIARAVSVPVVAAGGIADGAGMAAAFLLGAEGVQCGTCFVASTECTVHPNYKAMVLKASDISTTVTGRSGGHPIRALKSPLTREYQLLEKNGAGFEELEQLTLGSLRRAVLDGEVKTGTFMAGQSAGMVKEIRPCGEIIETMAADARDLLQSVARRFGGWI